MPRPGLCRMLKPHQPIMGISARTPRHSFGDRLTPWKGDKPDLHSPKHH